MAKLADRAYMGLWLRGLNGKRNNMNREKTGTVGIELKQLTRTGHTSAWSCGMARTRGRPAPAWKGRPALLLVVVYGPLSGYLIVINVLQYT